MTSQHFTLRDDQIRANCKAAIDALPAWKLYEVEIREPKKTRPQEKYWHMLLGIIARHTGDAQDEIKDRVKLAVLPTRTLVAKDRNGKTGTYILPAHSSTLTKEEYTRLIDATLMIFDELKLTAPTPGYYGIDLRGSQVSEVA